MSSGMTKGRLPMTPQAPLPSIRLLILSMTSMALLAAPVRATAPTSRPAGQEVDRVVVSESTEQVIRGALKYLASQQQPSGSWVNSRYQAAITAYVLMAFLSTGNLPNEGEYGRVVAKGTQFLLDCVRSDGLIVAASEGPSSHAVMYGHGIATIALAEIYGQTRDPMIRGKLERAIKLIVVCQNREGGWRYAPRAADADISVTVLQVVALRSAKNAGIDVPQETLDRAVKYVRACQDPKTGGFGYQPRGGPGFARTAAAVYSLQVCGLYEDEMVQRGSQYLLNTKERGWFTYGNFYAAPAQYMVGGQAWQQWYEKISQELLMPNRLKRMGDVCYWDPIDPGQGVSPVYATAVYTTILAMPYHYLPLYQR